MGTIRIQDVTKEFGGQTVLSEISVEFQSGQVTGLVGANGTGKTTLFRLINGEITPDIGTVTTSKGMQLGYLTQEPQVNLERTLYAEATEALANLRRLEQRQHELGAQLEQTPPGAAQNALLAEYDRVHGQFLAAGGYNAESKVHEVLGGLGFSHRDYELPMSALSGGQKCRVALAKLLLQEHTFLLLDEPTNHLDIDAVAWLEKFLAGFHGGAIVISHDRYLLDRIADRIVELDRGRLTAIPGNYSNYVKVKAQRKLAESRQFEVDQAFIEQERAFINKHMGKQRTAEAKGRLKRLERRLKSGELQTDRPDQGPSTVKLAFDEGEATSGWLVDAIDLAKGYDDKQLFSDVTLRVNAGEFLGITGPNGTGKSTLLKILLGEVEHDAGEITLNERMSVGYFAQEARKLDPELTVLEYVSNLVAPATETQARGLLGRFLFRGDDVVKPLGQLSGGEQSRIRLLELILERPNVLYLDEPTNHLDIPSREALEEALEGFPGAIVAVSHDRYFLDRLAWRLLVMRPEGHRLVQGNYSAYRTLLEEEEQAAARKRNAGRADQRRGGKGSSNGKRPAKAQDPYRKHSLEEIEGMIFEVEAAVEEINTAFADPAVAADAARIAELREQFDTHQAKLAELHSVWERKAEEHEAEA